MPLMPPHCSLLSGKVTHIENVTPSLSPGHQTDIKAIPTIPRPRRLISSSFSYYESPQYVCHLLGSVGQGGGTRRRGAQGHHLARSFQEGVEGLQGCRGFCGGGRSCSETAEC